MNPYNPSQRAKGEGLLEFARRVLRYNVETGRFVWLETRNGRALAGSVAGSCNQDGYIAIRLDGRVCLAHRLAWMFEHGSIPAGVEIDHKNGIRSDNSIDNLRLADDTLNAQNIQTATSRSRTGLLGVSSAGSRFRAFICTNGKRQALGTFDTAEQAHTAYVAAKRTLHAGTVL